MAKKNVDMENPWNMKSLKYVYFRAVVLMLNIGSGCLILAVVLSLILESTEEL